MYVRIFLHLNYTILQRSVVALLLLISQPITAQQFPVLHYSIADGLPSNVIYSIYRDAKGFLWFATDKGIARYNGIRFETFSTFDGLPDNEIFLFKEDHQRRLWLSTYNGRLCFYKDGVFHTAANTPYLKMPIKVPHIVNITLERDSSLTFNSYNPAMLINIKNETKRIYSFDVFNKEVNNDIYYKRKIAPNVFKLIKRDKIIYTDSLCHVLQMVERKVGGASIYVPTQDSGYFINTSFVANDKFDKNVGYIFSSDLDSLKAPVNSIFKGKIIRAYYSDKPNSFYATNNGLIINEDMLLLKNEDISSLTQDAEGNYWISTLSNGVYCLNKDFLSNRVISNVYDRGIKYSKCVENVIYFVSRNNNLYRIKDNEVTCLVDYFALTGDNNEIDRGETHLIDSKAAIYLDLKTDRHFIYDLADGKTKIVNHNVPGFLGIKNSFVFGDKIYLASHNKILAADINEVKKGGVFNSTPVYYSKRQRIDGIDVASGNGLWFSTLDNMYTLRNDTAIATPKFNLAFKNFIFADSFIIGYSQDNQLFVINYLDNSNTVDTIPSQNCIWNKLYILDAKHILITTNNLYRILTLYENRRYEISAIENLFIPNQVSNICMDSSRCYFFKDGAVTMIPKHTLLDIPEPPKLYFTVVKGWRNTYYNISEGNNKLLELPYNESKNITVRFTRVVAIGQKICQQYSVSRNGVDYWRDVEGEEINFLNSDYGDYIIKLRAKTMSSNYSLPVVLTLHILRPFWAAWWFILLLVCVLVMMVLAVMRYRISHLIRKNEKTHQDEMKSLKSEYKALNALMNPHFVFNTLNNVQGLVNRNDKLAANEYIRVFADLIRQNMHNLSKELIPLQKEVDLVVNYLLLEKLRFKDLLNYTLHIDDDLDLSEIMVPPLLIQPLVENSIKHGILPLESIEGRIQIHIFEISGILYIQVRDNGVGVDKSQEVLQKQLHESFGLDNIKQRISQLSILLEKEITLQMSKEEKGGCTWTIVSISMPNT